VSSISAQSLQQADADGSFIDFKNLNARLPYSPRALREIVRKGIIPSIVMPGGRKRVFHWPSVEAALKRRQQGQF
jgi:hypothetical protein